MNEDKANRFYELGYLLSPTIAETEVAGELTRLTSALEAVGAVFHSQSEPEFIDLAYTVEKHQNAKKNKFNQAYFGWIKFESVPSALIDLKKDLDSNLNLIRYILLKTDVENVVVFKNPKAEARRDSLLSDEEIDTLISETDEATDDFEEHEKLPSLEEGPSSSNENIQESVENQ